jgi:hypothetical protein
MSSGDDPQVEPEQGVRLNRKQKRAAKFGPAVQPATKPMPPPASIPLKWRWITGMRSIVEIASAKISTFNTYIAGKLKTTQQWIFNFEVGGLLFLGFTLMQIGESAAAIICWVILAFILIAKSLTWEGIKDREWGTRILKGVMTFGSLALCVVLITITSLRKPDTEPWSNLQKISQHPIEKPVTEKNLEEVAIYMECQFDHYPIKIPAGSTIHVIPLQPDLLRGNPNFRAAGIFRDVTATDTELTWPSKSDGSWPSKAEAMENLKKGTTGMPFVFKCSLSSFGKSTVEDISIPMLVRPMRANAKGNTYQVDFDPLISGAHFPFYVTNYCQDQVYVTWPDSLRVHVMGEDGNRSVPLKMIKRSWPGDFMIFMSSAFKWSSGQKCNWEWQ